MARVAALVAGMLIALVVYRLSVALGVGQHWAGGIGGGLGGLCGSRLLGRVQRHERQQKIAACLHQRAYTLSGPESIEVGLNYRARCPDCPKTWRSISDFRQDRGMEVT